MMEYECIGVNGFAGDRTPDAMFECHKFTEALANHLKFPHTLVGQSEKPRDLLWHDALIESKVTFDAAINQLNRVFSHNRQPILVTPRCATAIASLPIIVTRYADVVVLYFDAHGDLNTPQSTVSSYLGGMTITAALGAWDSGYGAGLSSENIVHVGGRDIEQSEQAFIKANNILAVSKGDIERCLDELEAVIRNKPIFIHLDTDVFDPSEVTAEYAVDNGLFRQHVKKVVDLVLEHGQLIGIEITELSPTNDEQRIRSYSALFESFAGLKKC